MVHSECTIPFLRKKRLASPTPWISMGFYTSRFLESAKKFSTACHEISPPLLFWLQRFPWRPWNASRRGNVTCPGPRQFHAGRETSRMEPCCRSPLEIEINSSHSSHPCGVQKALVVKQTHQILKKSRCWKSWRYCWFQGGPQRKQTQDETSIRSTCEILINLFMPYRIEVLLKFEIWLSQKVFFLAFQKRNIFVLNILIYRFERGVDATKALAVLKEYHSARDPTLPFFQVGHGTVRVP